MSIWKPNGRTPRAISLTRVSSDPKFESTSHDTQHAGNLRCIAELGATLYAHYEETISGALYLAREETQRALDDLENDRAVYLILYDMTRYGRSVRWQQEILHRIERAGKRIQFASFRLDYDEYENTLTMWSRNAFNNFGNASENERYAIRERTQRGVKRQLELGVMPKRSRCAFGYSIVTKADVIRDEQPREMLGKYFVKPDEAEPARAIFEQIALSGSLSTLSRYMLEHYPPSIYGRYWRRACLANIIRNPIYKGKAAYGKRRSLTD